MKTFLNLEPGTQAASALVIIVVEAPQPIQKKLLSQKEGERHCCAGFLQGYDEASLGLRKGAKRGLPQLSMLPKRESSPSVYYESEKIKAKVSLILVLFFLLLGSNLACLCYP